jgi:hypothetical protein
MAGSALTGVARHAAFAGNAAWPHLALGPAGKPSGLVMLAAVTLTCLLIALLAAGARTAAAATAVPLTSRAAALREKSWRAAFVPQLDPDAPGRARPRAPSGRPAAA